MATRAEEITRIEAELVILRNAISTIPVNGQSVSIGDITYSEVNFAALCAREKQTASELARLNGQRPRILGVNFTEMYR
ncbi:MAG: hypothetical protein WC373_01855 [Smithella sp.]|jgi:hypothetical protein